ncbi:hypothetical protein [Geomonas propionica]|uniref:Uncharacterized protein n=1 Tax=Geomonas propionica TaxID=2798582 RepID=A0ABS0YP25_9BACT|nr:hypothetical protein [Geomonas propionica]MBJ6799728.1 hypothetical protein [Geomonas propionica]
MKKAAFHPFANESESLQIGEFTIENRQDRVSLYGSIDLWRDKGGLRAAQELKTLLDSIVEVLEQESLPDKVELVKGDTVSNPFE